MIGPSVDLGICVGAECIKAHGTRIATWAGRGPCSAYVVCDECHRDRLTDEERAHMVELRGADRVRAIGLHGLHHGRFADDPLRGST